MNEKFRIFNVKELSHLLEENDRKLFTEINNETEDFILNVNEITYIDCLTEKYTIESLNINPDKMFIRTYRKSFIGEQSPKPYIVTSRETHQRTVIVYHIPYQGNSDLFKYSPTPKLIWSWDVFLEEQSICFEIIMGGQDKEKITNEVNSVLKNMKQQLAYVNHQIDTYNKEVKTKIETTFKKIKQELLMQNDIIASLNVPIKKKETNSETFSIPLAKSKKKIPKPQVKKMGYQPEPTMDVTIYYDILQTIFELGVNIERLPSIYTGRNEEELRDFFLLILGLTYEGSSTGETFNKGGKTDILMRYKNSNIFIAECKIWRGKKKYLDSINQLLKYLTFRDSKSAIILFIQNQDISSIINEVEKTTPKHLNYLGFVDKKEKTWFNYRIHINGDPNKEIKLAVLLFHIPPLIRKK